VRKVIDGLSGANEKLNRVDLVYFLETYYDDNDDDYNSNNKDDDLLNIYDSSKNRNLYICIYIYTYMYT
jgi:hypothetical protein